MSSLLYADGVSENSSEVLIMGYISEMRDSTRDGLHFIRTEGNLFGRNLANQIQKALNLLLWWGRRKLTKYCDTEYWEQYWERYAEHGGIQKLAYTRRN